MAEDLIIERPMTLVEPPKRERRRFVHARKFMLAYAALALLALGAVGLLYMGMTAEREEAQQWDAWAPTGEGEAGLWDIAREVASRYADGQAQTPFSALPGPPVARVRSGTTGETEQIPLDAVLITGANADQVRLDTAVTYSICGRGQNCQITAENLQREYRASLNGALELALYTFKFEEDVESVLFFMPPVPAPPAEAGEDGLLDTAIFIQRKDVQGRLDAPLKETPLDRSGDIDTGLLRFMRERLYTFTFDASSQGASLLRLTPYGS